ncbi:hypothetical protein T492DRAFT_1007589 [Pavlovales sp. CCMP2436]|nr:hypothetical protein T492DRAFT_1007589 [Pavlovales sp. CCMP2436]|mmetsp:Transcript_6584/g.17118  ORF Transcript_6584/g.17118 Transcript_6584/m.17118 type:complete len:285 (+) Transcript_6584:137-991(+)
MPRSAPPLASPGRSGNHMRAASEAERRSRPPTPRRAPRLPAPRPIQPQPSQLWAQVKRDAGGTDNEDAHSLLLHHRCRYQALSLLSGGGSAGQLHSDWLKLAISGLAFEDTRYQQAVMRKLDSNKDGRISYQEYLHATLALDSVGSKVAFAFACHDTDCNGRMTREELRQMFAVSLGGGEVGVIEGMVDELFAEAGRKELLLKKDQSDELTLDDLLALAHGLLDGPEPRATPGEDRGQALVVWDLFGATLCDSVGDHHRSVDAALRRAQARKAPIPAADYNHLE